MGPDEKERWMTGDVSNPPLEPTLVRSTRVKLGIYIVIIFCLRRLRRRRPRCFSSLSLVLSFFIRSVARSVGLWSLFLLLFGAALQCPKVTEMTWVKV